MMLRCLQLLLLSILNLAGGFVVQPPPAVRWGAQAAAAQTQLLDAWPSNGRYDSFVQRTGARERRRRLATERRSGKGEPARLEDVPDSLKREIIVLREEETGRAIECYPDAFAVVEGQRYVIAEPCDWCVSIGRPSKDGNLEPVPVDGELMDHIFPMLQSYLEDDDIHLFRTPVTLTLQGEFEEEDDEEDDDVGEDEFGADLMLQEGIDYEVIDEPVEGFTVEDDGARRRPGRINGAEDEEDEEDDDDDDEGEYEATDVAEEGVELVASFWDEGTEYSLVRHLEPVLLVARANADGGYSLLSEAEAPRVNPVMEKLMADELFTRQEEQQARSSVRQPTGTSASPRSGER